jgi:hypothetical protein
MNDLIFFVLIAIVSAAFSILFLGFPDAFKKWAIEEIHGVNHTSDFCYFHRGIALPRTLLASG